MWQKAPKGWGSTNQQSCLLELWTGRASGKGLPKRGQEGTESGQGAHEGERDERRRHGGIREERPVGRANRDSWRGEGDQRGGYQANGANGAGRTKRQSMNGVTWTGRELEKWVLLLWQMIETYLRERFDDKAAS